MEPRSVAARIGLFCLVVGLLPAQEPATAHVVTGRVVAPDGTPVVGATVVLMGPIASAADAHDPIGAYLHSRTSGARRGELARGLTAADGTFELRPAGTTAGDLFVLHPRHADLERTEIALGKEPVLRLGDLQLDPGVRVAGRVVDERGQPVVGATVRLVSSPTTLLQATPGRERGLVVPTDGDGGFVFAHVPRQHRVVLHVEAVGCLRHLQMASTEELAKAPLRITARAKVPTTGLVVDEAGQPVVGARVEAFPSTVLGGSIEAVAVRADGAFTLWNLTAGQPHRLRVTAPGFFDGEWPEVEGGVGGELLRLERVPRVHMRVVTADGVPVGQAHVALRRVDGEGRVSSASVPGCPPRPYGPADAVTEGDRSWWTLSAAPMGTVVLQVDDGVHAPAFSREFQIARGEVPRVEVVLRAGAVLTGTVLDADGRPLAGVAVASDGEAPAPAAAAQPTESRVLPRESRVVATTDAAGRFELARLAPGRYRIRARHESWCSGEQGGIVVTRPGERRQLAPMQLQRGSVVHGVIQIAKRGQRPAVELAAVGQDGMVGSARWRCTADAEGRFRFLERIPPGRYEVVVRSSEPGVFATRLPRGVAVEVPADRDEVVLDLAQGR